MRHQVRKSVYFALSGLAILLSFVFYTPPYAQSNPVQAASSAGTDEIFLNFNFSPDAPKEVKQLNVRHRKFFIGQNRN